MQSQIEDIRSEIKDGMEIIPVKHASEALPVVFKEKKKQPQVTVKKQIRKAK